MSVVMCPYLHCILNFEDCQKTHLSTKLCARVPVMPVMQQAGTVTELVFVGSAALKTGPSQMIEYTRNFTDEQHRRVRVTVTVTEHSLGMSTS
jgi:hypothetical protein